MALTHRRFLKVLALGLAGIFPLTGRLAHALERNAKAFQARSPKDVLTALSPAAPEESKAILLRAPDIASDGDQVEVLVASKIANTEVISILVDSNTQPLALSVAILPGAEPRLSAVLRFRKTSLVTALVQAGGKTYRVSREVKVASASDCKRTS